MFYALFYIILGVYLGQEYNLPSIKGMTFSVYHNYIKEKIENEIKKEEFRLNDNVSKDKVSNDKVSNDTDENYDIKLFKYLYKMIYNL